MQQVGNLRGNSRVRQEAGINRAWLALAIMHGDSNSNNPVAGAHLLNNSLEDGAHHLRGSSNSLEDGAHHRLHNKHQPIPGELKIPGKGKLAAGEPKVLAIRRKSVGGAHHLQPNSHKLAPGGLKILHNRKLKGARGGHQPLGNSRSPAVGGPRIRVSNHLPPGAIPHLVPHPLAAVQEETRAPGMQPMRPNNRPPHRMHGGSRSQRLCSRERRHGGVQRSRNKHLQPMVAAVQVSRGVNLINHRHRCSRDGANLPNRLPQRLQVVAMQVPHHGNKAQARDRDKGLARPA